MRSPTREERRSPVSTTAWPWISRCSFRSSHSVVRPEPSEPSMTMRCPLSPSSRILGRWTPKVGNGAPVRWGRVGAATSATLRAMDEDLLLREPLQERLDPPADLGGELLDGLLGVDDLERLRTGEAIVLALQHP